MTVRLFAAKEQYYCWTYIDKANSWMASFDCSSAKRQSRINISYRHMTAKDLDACAIHWLSPCGSSIRAETCTSLP